MAYAPKSLYRGVPPTSAATVYTSTAGTIIKSIILSNQTSSSAQASCAVGTVNLFANLVVPANSVVVVESSELEVMSAAEIVQFSQNTASALTARINGVTF